MASLYHGKPANCFLLYFCTGERDISRRPTVFRARDPVPGCPYHMKIAKLISGRLARHHYREAINI